MSGPRRSSRALIGVVLLLLIGIPIMIALRSGEEAHDLPARPESPQAGEAAPEPEGDESTGIDRGSNDPAHPRGRAPAQGPVDVAVRTGSAAKQVSILDQLIAIHAISSQADVSAFLEKNAELAKKHVDRFCDESRRLPPLPWSPPGAQRDAAALMVELDDWAEPSRTGKIHLPEAIAARIRDAGSDWPTVLNAADFAGLDFSWMRDLHSYDHWSLVQSPPLIPPPLPTVAFAIPNYVTLWMWAKLRFAQALAGGDLLGASKDVRHIAELLHGHGILLGEMVSILLLISEREAFDAAQRRGLVAAGWDPLSRNDLEAWRKLDRAESSFLSPGVDPAVMKKAAACAPTPCVALAEASWIHVTMGSFSSEDTSSTLWPLLDRPDCNHAMLDLIRTGAPLQAEQAAQIFQNQSPIERAFEPDVGAH